MPFGKTGAVYTTPDVRLVLDGAAWLSDAAVSSWSVDRRLVASVIPGTIRQANGLSVGAASVSVINTESRVTPWSTDPARLVRTDLPAGRLEVVDGDETLPLGAWVLNPVTGALSSREVDVDLLEAQYAGKQRPQRLPAYSAEPFNPDSPVDPVWAIARLAEAAGFPATPPPVESAFLALPLDGSFMATVGAETYSPTGETPGWTLLPDGTVGGESGTTASMTASADIDGTPINDLFRSGRYAYFTLNVSGAAYLTDFVGGWQIKIVNDATTGTHTFGVCHNGTGAFASTPFTPSLDPDWPDRVQVRLSRTWDDATGRWSNTYGNARSSASAAWSAEVSGTGAFAPIAGFELFLVFAGTDLPDGGIVGAAPGQFSGLQVTRSDDPELWLPAKAQLKPLGADMGLPWVPPEMDTWTAIQNLCSAWLAAAILDSDGMLRVLSKDDLAGVAAGVPIVVDDDLEDLPWTSDPNDKHDRLEVTYAATLIRNAEVGTTKLAPEAWRAEDVIHVPAGATVTIDAALEDRGAVGIFSKFTIPGSESSAWQSQTSNVSVYGTPDGTGDPIPVEQIAIQADQTSATTARITYVNRSGASHYLVTDADLAEGGGEPSLILRARSVATYTPNLLARGKSVDDATNPLAVDLTPWVQRAQDAEAIANYLWGRLSGRAWKVESVKCRLDWTLDIGQIRTLTHPDSDLESKVLIAAVKYDGKPGQITQSLDLVLVPWTYADFSAAWAAVDPASTYADFATAQGSTRTYADMSADDNWTGA